MGSWVFEDVYLKEGKLILRYRLWKKGLGIRGEFHDSSNVEISNPALLHLILIYSIYIFWPDKRANLSVLDNWKSLDWYIEPEF